MEINSFLRGGFYPFLIVIGLSISGLVGCENTAVPIEIKLDLNSCIPSQSMCKMSLQDQSRQGCYLVQPLAEDGRARPLSYFSFAYSGSELVFSGSSQIELQEGERFQGQLYFFADSIDCSALQWENPCAESSCLLRIDQPAYTVRRGVNQVLFDEGNQCSLSSTREEIKQACLNDREEDQGGLVDQGMSDDFDINVDLAVDARPMIEDQALDQELDLELDLATDLDPDQDLVDLTVDQMVDCDPNQIGQLCDTGQLGVCAQGQYECQTIGEQRVLVCETSRVPSSSDTCNNQDDDCDGDVDEDFMGDIEMCGVGNCQNTVITSCVGGEIIRCQPREAEDEICNTQDDDCDGRVDENLDQITACPLEACVTHGKVSCINGQELNTCEVSQQNDANSDGISDVCGWREFPTDNSMQPTLKSIMLHEVTEKAYQECVEAGQCSLTRFYLNTESGPSCQNTAPRPNPSLDLPLVCVIRSEMERFCQWAKGRLPTDNELIQASRFFEIENTLSWGCDNAVLCESESQVQPICSLQDETQTPICDLIGNATEMSSTEVGASGRYYNCNGDYRLSSGVIHTCYGGGDVEVPHVGGRCIRD